MRIIAGELKGRKLATPKNDDIRPTPEKVKEALFSMLMQDIPGAVCCDLFAGTGALGFEALSRGASYCYFGDHAQESITLIRQNAAHLGVEDRCQIVHGNYKKTLANLDRPVDVFFLDPPYKKNLLTETIEAIGAMNVAAKDCILVAEHAKDQELAEVIGPYRMTKTRRYGIVEISLYM